MEYIIQERERLIPYFDHIKPTCFLDDVTVKNVIMLNGELQGIIDLDCVCYGDPLYMITLTHTAIIDIDRELGSFYIDEICRLWNITDEQRKIVDFYTVIFSMQFFRFYRETKDTEGMERRLRFIKQCLSLEHT